MCLGQSLVLLAYLYCHMPLEGRLHRSSSCKTTRTTPDDRNVRVKRSVLADRHLQNC